MKQTNKQINKKDSLNISQISFDLIQEEIQLTLAISTSLIPNNRLSRSENLIPA